MAITVQTINGHQYQVTTDAAGKVISQVGVDPLNALPIVSRSAFRQLFTLAERIAIDNPSTVAGLTAAQIATVNTISRDFQSFDYMDLSSPSLKTALDLLVTYGILTAARETQILAGQ